MMYVSATTVASQKGAVVKMKALNVLPSVTVTVTSCHITWHVKPKHKTLESL